METLRRVAESMARAAREAGVRSSPATPRWSSAAKATALFINTTGIGAGAARASRLSAATARPGDVRAAQRLPSAITASRSWPSAKGLEFDTPVASDTAALHTLVAAMLDAESAAIRCAARPHARRPCQHAQRDRRQSRAVGIALEEARHPGSRGSARRLRTAGTRPALRRQRGQAGRHRGARGRPDAVLAAHAPASARRATPRIIGTVTEAHPGLVTHAHRLRHHPHRRHALRRPTAPDLLRNAVTGTYVHPVSKPVGTWCLSPRFPWG